MLFKKDDNFISEQDKEFIKNVIEGDNFPLYLQRTGTTNTDKKSFYLSHTVVHRSEIRKEEDPFYNSAFAEPIMNIFYRFMEKHRICVNEVLRVNVNMTFPGQLKKCPVHFDHTFPHNQFLFYLDDFDKKAKTIILSKNKKNILHQVPPKKYRGVCFEGMPHYMIYPTKKVRTVFVYTFR